MQYFLVYNGLSNFVGYLKLKQFPRRTIVVLFQPIAGRIRDFIPFLTIFA